MSIGKQCGGDLHSLAGKEVSESTRVGEWPSLADNEALSEGGELLSVTLSSRFGSDLPSLAGKKAWDSVRGGDLTSLCPNSCI